MTSMRLRLTHLLSVPWGRGRIDALARPVDDEGGGRMFVPGWLPCGECARCRRGLVAACPRGRPLLEDSDAREPAAVRELDGRFIAPVDEPAGVTPLDDEQAVCAGLVAEVLEACARAGLGPEHLAVWLGDGLRSRIGARLGAGLGCPTFLGITGEAVPEIPGVTSLRLDLDLGAWRSAVQAGAATAPGEFRERRLFVTGGDPAASAVLLALADPGTTMFFLDPSAGPALVPSALPSCRVLIGGGHFHPDFVPEALAAVRRDPELVRGLVPPGRHAGEPSLVTI
jgi:hypothetical protein